MHRLPSRPRRRQEIQLTLWNADAPRKPDVIPSGFLSVDAAMQIGRLIRSVDGDAYAADKCYSSCALIFIAGVARFNIGTIGLDRPYSASSPQNREPIERQLSLLQPKLKTYVQEMGITDNFYEEMVNTDPSSVKLYDRKAIEKIVPERDPTRDEIETSYEARAYGVDTAEMRRRERTSIKYRHVPKL